MCNKYRSKKLTPVNQKFNKNNLKLIKRGGGRKGGGRKGGGGRRYKKKI